jgi:hypothetical protein
MNIYEQLLAMKMDLEDRQVHQKSIAVLDKMLHMAESEKNSGLSMSRLQVLRHVMRTPDVLNDEDIRLDFIGLEGDLEDAATARAESAPAYVEERAPKLKKYYKKK